MNPNPEPNLNPFITNDFRSPRKLQTTFARLVQFRGSELEFLAQRYSGVTPTSWMVGCACHTNSTRHREHDEHKEGHHNAWSNATHAMCTGPAPCSADVEHNCVHQHDRPSTTPIPVRRVDNLLGFHPPGPRFTGKQLPVRVH